MLRFVAAPRRLRAARDVLDQRPRLPHLLRDAGRRSGGADRREERSQQTLREVRKDFGLDKPMPVQYALMMKRLFVSRDLTSFVNRGAKVIPQVVRGGADHVQPRARRVRPLGDLRDRAGVGRRRLPGEDARRGRDDRRPDRHLDAGLLAGRGGEPVHAEPPARHVPVLVGAAARLRARSRDRRSAGSRRCCFRG